MTKNIFLKQGQKNPCATTCPPLLMDSPTTIVYIPKSLIPYVREVTRGEMSDLPLLLSELIIKYP